MAETSNIDRVVAWLRGFVDSFDFSRPGKDQSLGRDVANVIVRGPQLDDTGGILGRCTDGVGPEGTPWPANADSTVAQKQRLYGHEEVNRRTGQMLSQASLLGRTEVAGEIVTLRYGTGSAPSGSAAPTGYISEQDKAVTDMQKAQWAHTWQSRRGVLRPFYGMGQGDTEAVVAVCQENLDDYIRSQG
jgi:hypothetical protein